MSNTSYHAPKVRIGLIIESSYIPAWQALMLQKIIALGFTDIVLAVQNSPTKSKGLRLYHRLVKLDLKVKKVGHYALAKKSLRVFLPEINIIKLAHPKTKGKVEISETEQQEIDKYDINLWLQLSSGDFSNSSLVRTDFGLWRFQDFDRNYTNILYGFWEILNGMAMIESVLSFQKGDQSGIVYKTYSSVWSVHMNRTINPHYWKLSSLIPRKLADLKYLKKQEFINSLSNDNGNTEVLPQQTPNSINLIWPVFKYLTRMVKSKVSNRFFKRKWVLLFNLNSNGHNSFKDFKLLLPPENRQWADPFIVERNNKYYIFFEEFGPASSDRGHISLMIMDEKGNVSDSTKILQRPYHLSYPFIFYWEESYYMIPETAEKNAIELYKCIRFPDQWEYQFDLMTDIEAFDSTIIEYNQKWWLFTNIRENTHASSWDELYVFYSDNPLSQQWTPHPKNPVVSDACKARPAGNLYIENGNLFRPAQNCAMHYGYGLKINKILTLNTEEYVEQEVKSYEPSWSNKIKGLHTINKASNAVFIDALFQH